ncbi:MAG: permease prefix domain 1-containing protein, partial [Promethearchaeota archaeon]
MSEKNMEKLVKEFLKQVKEKLPEWLKSNKKELRDILDELREHIWAKAEELSSSGQPTEDSIRMAIAHMGTPQSIAKEYKRRGKPKVYITEELWPFYTKVLGILLVVVIAINVVSIVLSFVFGGSFSLDFGGLYLGLAGVFMLVTIIFVALSMEGYLPEDLIPKKDRLTEKELEKAERKGWPIHPKTGKPLKPFISPAGMLIGGIIQMAIGLVFMIQPNVEFLALMNPQFLFVIRLFGLFIVMEGTIDLCRAIIGNQQITT